ncbi:MAG: hypothetical protein GTO02_11015, partial [Candidatus Dadabacteria bacterium]|nr:hypothetical protein [Candidatus Dadabacteria bacterium]
VAVCIIGFSKILPSVMESNIQSQTERHSSDEPIFEKSHKPKIVELKKTNEKEFSFFKNAGNRMTIPEGGGILSMSVLPTEENAERPNTFQLWLTETELWRIRTKGDVPEVEQISYPESNPVENLYTLKSNAVSNLQGSSTITVSSETIDSLKKGLSSGRDEHM